MRNEFQLADRLALGGLNGFISTANITEARVLLSPNSGFDLVRILIPNYLFLLDWLYFEHMENSISYWEKDVWLKPFDFLIVGGGIVGMNAAIQLKRAVPTSRVGVIERVSVGAGASTRNAGFACFGSMSELLDDRNKHGEATMLQLVKRRWEGLQLLRKLVGDHRMDFYQGGGFELFLERDAELYAECMEALPEMNAALAEVTGQKEVFQKADTRKTDFGFATHVKHLIKNEAEGQLHPGKMMEAFYQLAAELDISLLRGVEVVDLQAGDADVQVVTSEGWQLRTGRVLLATNGFTRKLLPELELEPARNQVMITQPIPNLPVSGTFHYNRGYVYFRNVGDRLLLGGGRDLDLNQEMTAQFGTSPFIQAYLEKLLSVVILPDREFEVDAWWSGILGIGPQKVPIVRMVDERVGVAVRLGGMGVAIGSLVGKEAADMLLEKER